MLPLNTVKKKTNHGHRNVLPKQAKQHNLRRLFRHQSDISTAAEFATSRRRDAFRWTMPH